MRKQIVEWVRDGISVTEVARLAGLSRKTVYKWAERSAEAGGAGLSDRSRSPRHVRRFEGELAEWLLEVRRRYPRWGPTKLLDYAKRHRPDDARPARSTVAELLKRHGLIAPRPARAPRAAPFLFVGPTPTEPNARWTMDFKGDFRLGDGTWMKPFTLRDAASRMVLDVHVTPTVSSEGVKDRLKRAFRKFGKPQEIQSDTGQPFASSGLGKLTTLSVWLLLNDVLPVLSRPGKPQDNGAHERMHRDYKADTTRPPAANRHAQQHRSNIWIRYFNEERPHDALAGDVPAEHWHPSPRRYEPPTDPPRYPGWWEIRYVDLNGDLSWRNQRITCGKALRSQLLGLEPIDDRLWRLHLARFPIGFLDERHEPRILGLQNA